jgi:SAM-dependent methyltransferase
MLETTQVGSLDSSLRSIDSIFLSRFSGKPVRIYEAGGGSISYLRLDSLTRRHITVVDIDESQLQNNKYADEKVHGDIQTLAFEPNSFDLIVCYNVIEHLDFPDQALSHFRDALAQDGLIFIAAPHPMSFSGLVTRFTPHWFHVWVYRAILRRPGAGHVGQPPFRVVYHRIVAPQSLRDFCGSIDLEVVYYKQFESRRYREVLTTRWILGRLLFVFTGLLNALSFGRSDFRVGEYHIILAKKG